MKTRFYKYIAQSVAGMIGFSIYILADTFFISLSAGANGLAVLNLALPIYGIMFAVGAMIGIGTATRFGIDKECDVDTSFYFMEALFWCLVFSAPFVLIGILSPETALRVMGADDVLVGIGRGYIRAALIGAPAFMTNYTFTSFARNDNAARSAMIGTLSGSAFNIAFDYILMFPCHMGIVGAGVATAISPVVTILVCTCHYLLFLRGKTLRFKWRKPNLLFLWSCMALGISGFVGEISSAVTTTVYNFLILKLAGNTGVAAYGIAANVALIVMAVFNGIAQGAQPLISESYGKGDRDAVRKYLKMGLVITFVIEIAAILVGLFATDFIISIFNSEGNDTLYSYANVGLRLYFLGFIFAGINVYVISFFTATDRAGNAFIGSILRGFVAIIACAVILSVIFGMNGIWISFMGAELITFIVMVLLLKKSEIKTQERN